MAAISIAILSKDNVPLYLRDFGDANIPDEELFGITDIPVREGKTCSLGQQFLIHAATDRLEQMAGPLGMGLRRENHIGTDAMFLGLLYPVEDMRVYGYSTTTNIKFLLVVKDNAFSDQNTIDQTIKRLLVKVHRLYTEYILNPFSSMKSITSKRFDEKIDELVHLYNRAIQITF